VYGVNPRLPAKGCLMVKIEEIYNAVCRAPGRGEEDNLILVCPLFQKLF
jgi:hypothetical protein